VAGGVEWGQEVDNTSENIGGGKEKKETRSRKTTSGERE